MITPPPIVRWQKWVSERTAYIRVFYPDDAVAVFAETHPHVVKAIEESSLSPGARLSVLYNADDDCPVRLYSILEDALADAEKEGFVVVSIDWAGWGGP
jgi:hypothetical protein